MKITIFSFVAVLFLILIASMTGFVHAQSNTDAIANAQCAAEVARRAAINQPPPPNPPFPCKGPHASGMCMGPICQATDAPGLNGGNAMQGLSQLGQLLGQLLSKLGQSSGSGSGSGSASPTGATGCTSSYYYTSNTALIGVDPCALYQQGTTCTDTTATNYGASAACTYSPDSSTSTSAASLLSALNGTSGGSTSGDTLSASPTSGSVPLPVTFTTNPIDSTQTYTVDPGDGGTPVSLTSNGCTSNTSSTCVYGGTYTYSAPGTFTATLEDASGEQLATASVAITNPNGATSTVSLSQVLSNIGGLLAGSSTESASGQTSPNFPGVFGNILLDQNGATIFAATISGNNSETSGFYGSDTLNSQPQGGVAQLCQNRPWSSNFLADIIPPSFFDSLCQWGGYQVGQTQPASTAGGPQVTLTQQAQTSTTQTSAATTTAATTTSAIAPQAVIWAVPSAVPLGARTSVYWNTQGVTQCTESSPDGSFNESSLSGAAATVPLTGATTFTISCLDPNGNPVTNYVTVSISN